MKIDEIDKRILDFLQKDAKLTAKEMAAKLSLTPTPIYERIKKLERLGIIKSYVALLDEEKVNRSLTVFLNITIKEHHNDYRQKFIDDISLLRINKINLCKCFFFNCKFKCAFKTII